MPNLDTTGVRFVSDNFQGFLSDLGKATQAITNFGRMTQNRLAALKHLEGAIKSTSSAVAREASANAKLGSSYNRLLTEKQRTTQATIKANTEMLKLNATAIQSNSAFRMFATGLGTLAPRLSPLTTMLLGVVRGITGMGKEAESAVPRVDKFGFSMKRVFEIALGFIVRDVFYAIARGIRTLASDMFQGAVVMQKLQIRFENLVASQIMAGQTTRDFDAAIKQAVAPASELLHWINQLSLKVPFERDAIANTVGLAMAMGFTSEQSKALTLSMSDFTAGMALSNEHLERILYNFGQMKAAGKILGTELKDLARGALVPVNDVLLRTGEAMGLTGAELQRFTKDAVAMGGSVDIFIQKFMEIVEERFPNAAERMGRSWEGVMIRFRNAFKIIGGTALLGPLMQKVAGQVADALDSVMSPAVLRGATVLGISLGQAFDSIVKGVGAVTRAFGEIKTALGLTLPSVTMFAAAISVAAEMIGEGMANIAAFISRTVTSFIEKFSDSANSALAWGFNIVENLATGIVRAASTVLIWAMNFVGKILKFFLGPGSPPRVAPDIDKWGIAAMTEFLRGFTKADFSILNAIQSPIKSALDALSGLGLIDKDAIGGIMADLSLGMAEFLRDFSKTGEIDTGFLDKIRSATGEFGEEIVLLTKRQIELAGAIKAVEEAELRLKAAQDAVTSGRTKVRQGIKEYNQLLREGASKAVLDAKLKEINAQEKLLDQAVKEEQASQQSLENAKASQDVIKESAEIQAELVKQLIELARLQALDVGKDISGRGGAGAGEGEPEEEDPWGLGDFDLDSLTENLTETMTEELEKAKEQIRQKLRELKQVFDDWLEETLGPDWQQRFSDAWDGMTGAISIAWNEGIMPILDDFSAWWEEDGTRIQTRVGELWGVISTVIGTAATLIGGYLAEIGQSLSDVGLNTEELDGIWSFAWTTILGIIGIAASAIGLILLGLTTVITGFFGGIAEGFERAKKSWNGVLLGIRVMVDGAKILFESFGELIKKIFGIDQDENSKSYQDIFSGMWKGIRLIWDGFWIQFRSKWQARWDFARGFIEGFKDSVIEFFEELKEKLIGNSIITDMMDAIENKITETLNRITDFWKEKWDALSTKAKETKDSIVEFATNLADSIKEKFENIRDDLSELGTKIDDFKTNALDALTSGLNSAKEAFDNIVGAIGGFISAVLAGDFRGALDIMKALIGKSPSPLAIGIQTASKAMKEMSTTALPKFTKEMNALVAPLIAANITGARVTAPALVSAPAAVRGQSVSFGDTNIYTDMDAALFQARVLQIVRNEYGS
jgi:tape measure domain-containing protein